MRTGKHHSARVRQVALLSTLLVTGCIHRYYETERTELEAPGDSFVQVSAAMRAHLADGGLAIFARGGRVGPDAIVGVGVRYDLTRQNSAVVQRIPLDSVLGIEAFDQRLDQGKSVGVSVLATAAATAVAIPAIAAAAVAIFGSCPTVYTDSAGVERLQAELFSYSIAPLLEGRDVSLMHGGSDAEGTFRLEVRNEALETHFINHLELLEVRHENGERALPDGHRLPIAIAAERPLLRAVDRGGRDVTAELRTQDDIAPITPEAMLLATSANDFMDHLELVFARPSGDSAVLVLRLRNSLLNTVLFYDVMLGAAGARALDWLGNDLQRIGPAVNLGRWWMARMGMRVSVKYAVGYQEVARLPDTGPIAWTEAAIVIPVPAGSSDRLRVRLSSVIDAWRLDGVALAESFRRIEPRVLPIGRVLDASGASLESARAALAVPDEEYVQTTAGDRFIMEFDVGPPPANGSRTLLLASQGYYTEWVRPAWIRGGINAMPVEPSDRILLEGIETWRAVRSDFEQKFYETRIPTR